ncbi:cyclase family protein [Roseivirga sp.]|uniref:cyclase family protein n=1 Tax=Roseivirga sp. TaxID=1964215 RepID=UPI003B8DD994
MSNKFIDITFELTEDLPLWPGGIGFESKKHKTIPKDIANVSSIKLGCHYGTHLDSPLHFIENGSDVSNIDINELIGPAYVIEIFNTNVISASHLESVDIHDDCTRLLIKTDNQALWNNKVKSFDEDFCALDQSAANWLIQNNIKLVGIDYLSIQKYSHGPEVHQVLLEKGIIIVECLKLDGVEKGWYDLICLPLRLTGLEGAPVRAVLLRS